MGSCNCKEEPTAQVDAESLATAEAIPAVERANEIVVAIVSARGLHDADWFPGTDRFFYCTLKFEGEEEELYRTSSVKDTLAPVWKEEVAVPLKSNGGLELCIYDADADEKGEAVGKALLESAQFILNGFNGELQLEWEGKLIGAHLKVKVRMSDREYPEGPLKEFHACIENRTQSPLGLDVDMQDGCSLYVTDVQEGPVQAYNEGVPPAKQVLKGDFIMKVNGLKGSSAALVEALKTATTVDLVVRRPVEFLVAVDANDPHALRGVSVKKGCANSIVITAVEGGPVKAWNDAYPEQEVRAGDRIIAVNGEKSRASVLLQKFKASKCHVTVVRPAEPEEAAPKTPR